MGARWRGLEMFGVPDDPGAGFPKEADRHDAAERRVVRPGELFAVSSNSRFQLGPAGRNTRRSL